MIAVVIAAFAMSMSLGPDPGSSGKSGKVRCEIQIIHATRGKPFVDPTLKPLKRYLENSFGSKYQSFKQVSKRSMPLSRGQRSSEALPNDTQLSLTYLGGDGSRLRLLMEVGGLKTRVKVHNGGLFFQAGRRYKGGMLIVAVRAHIVR